MIYSNYSIPFKKQTASDLNNAAIAQNLMLYLVLQLLANLLST